MRRDAFQAIADPTRREILKLIAQKRTNLNALAAHFEVSRPAISKQIKILEECGMLQIKQIGRQRFCEPTPQKLTEVSKWIAQYSTFWNGKLDAMGDFLNQQTDNQP